MNNLKVSEIFYSLQGEGHWAGTPFFFVRLTGCSAKHACYASGVMCDTEFESGKEWELKDLLNALLNLSTECKKIIWTGGEPCDQLTEEHTKWFAEKGYWQNIETSGLKPVPLGIDFVSVSPKVAEHVLAKNFPNGVDELRYVRHKGQEIPEPSIPARYYYLSPHFNAYDPSSDNIRHCINLCLQYPRWRLSLQNHKLIGVL